MRFWTQQTLLQRFTLASAVIAVGLAVVLSLAMVQTIQTFAVKDEAQVAAELVLRTFAPQLRVGDFGDELPADRRALFDALFRAHGISDTILRIRLWRADGRLLYSNASEPETLGIVRADISSEQGFEEFVRQRQRLVTDIPGVGRFFVPVHVAGNPRTLGAFEIFYDLTLLQQRLASTRRTIWTAVPAGLFLLYASVFVLVRRASRQLLKQQADLVAAHIGTYHALATALDAKDAYTGDHSVRVANLAVHLGRTLGLTPETLEEIKIGARLHDLGKISVPDAILNKTDQLTLDEHVLIQQHAEAGFAILRYAPLSDQIKQGVRHTHERWDGLGYPDGLSREAIPLLARIIAVVDAYEAMTSDRPYRRGLSMREALVRLQGEAGAHFDPNVVEAFVDLVLSQEDYPTAAPRRAADSPSTRPA